MRVEKQPSPWPWVILLGGLLLFCLTVPRFWRADPSVGDLLLDAAPESTIEFPRAPGAIPVFDANPRRAAGYAAGHGPFSAGDVLNPAAPTIEELVANRATNGFGMPPLEWPVLAAPAVAPADLPLMNQDFSLASADPIVLAALEGAGQALARYSTLAELLPQLVTRAANSFSAWFDVFTPDRMRVVDGAAPPSRVTMRLIGPNDRLAMLPQDRFSASADSFGGGPKVLLEQLERLAEQPESSAWAARTMAELNHLLTGEGLTTSDIQQILANLSEATLDAARMADVTADDRLRVELLRAHWGLARRLDRWSVTHEIHVAARSQDRIAVRGPLNGTLASQGDSRGSITAKPEAALARDVETYEYSRDPRLARQIAQLEQQLKASPDTLDHALGDAVEQHYRNANVRVAITAEMLNRLVGEKQHTEMRRVNDRIAGANVRGNAVTQSESRVRLEPAEGRWQLEVEAEGVVDSNTTVNGGPARLRNMGQTDFTARRSIVVDPNGVSMQPTDADAVCQNRLMGVTTDYDWLPLVGSYTRQRAVEQYRAKQNRATNETELRVANQASELMDDKTQQAVDKVREQFRERLTNRLKSHGLELTPVEMTSTEQRVVARLRVAGDAQLGSHTPRPRALSDSLASVQVHESALTNVAVTLGLDGKTYTAPELRQKLREQFPQRVSENAAEAHPDTVFHFAAEDAVQVRIENGRLELTVSLINMEHEGRSMRNVVIHAFYVPAIDGLHAELVRDGSLGVEGRLSSGQRARLHNIFNSVLPPERHINLVQVERTDHRFDGLMVTQLVLEDGWIGLAIGPGTSDRVAERSRSLR